MLTGHDGGSGTWTEQVTNEQKLITGLLVNWQLRGGETVLLVDKLVLLA